MSKPSFYPTWEQMGVPSLLVNAVKGMQSNPVLDSLVHQLIFRNRKSTNYQYYCYRCDWHWTTHSGHDVPPPCPNCGCEQFRCETQIRFASPVPPYSHPSKRNAYVEKLVSQMGNLHLFYFKGVKAPDISCGWRENRDAYHQVESYCQFPGGELAIDQTPKMCIIKAAVLCPYLWDTSFDWRPEYRDDRIFGGNLTSIIAQLTATNWKDQ